MKEALLITSEKPKNILEKVPFDGFNLEQKKKVKNQLNTIGLPLGNIREVRYRPNQRGTENVLGSFQPYDGVLTLYKSLEKLPPIAQQGTMVHEAGGHGTSPFDPKNERMHGGRESMKQSRDFVIAVAEQTDKTRTYLNGYHAYLHKQLLEGNIEKGRFVEETYAILMELRFTNPAHLAQVEAAQHEKLKLYEKIKNVKIEPVDLVSKRKYGKDVALSGLDTTIIKLIPRIENYDDLENHIRKVRESVAPEGKKPVVIFPQVHLLKNFS